VGDKTGGACSIHGRDENVYKLLVRKSEGRDHLEYLGIARRIILEWILKKQGVRLWSGFMWLRMGSSYGLL
jgi:hypothetical protein